MHVNDYEMRERDVMEREGEGAKVGLGREESREARCYVAPEGLSTTPLLSCFHVGHLRDCRSFLRREGKEKGLGGAAKRAKPWSYPSRRSIVILVFFDNTSSIKNEKNAVRLKFHHYGLYTYLYSLK